MRDKFVMNINEWYRKYKRRSNKCESCGKHYKLPNFIYEPRDRICASCEYLSNY